MVFFYCRILTLRCLLRNVTLNVHVLFTICFSYVTRINKNELNKPDFQVKVNPSCANEPSLWNDRYISYVVLVTVPPLGRVGPQYFPIVSCEAEGPSYICK